MTQIRRYTSFGQISVNQCDKGDVLNKMRALILVLILAASKAIDAFPRDLKAPRFLENPGDAATYLGYVQHKVPDMTSLVDEVAHQNPNAFSHPEKPASFSGGNTANGHLPYNLPNFPAMLNSQGSSQPLGPSGAVSAGSGGGSTSGSSGGGAVGTSGTGTNTPGGGGGGGNIPFGILPGSGATSGGGTASGTGSVDHAGAAINPLGIPSGPGFNIGSNTGSGSGPGMTAGGSGSGSSGLIGTSNGGVFQSFVCSSTSVLNSCPTECVEVDAQNGCPSCRSSCSSATGGSIHLGSATISTAPTSCPPYPSNCPQIYSTMQNGCHVCTILQQLHTVPHTTTTVPITHATCPPVKCLAPCNVGIIIKADGCPACKCPDHVF